MKNVHLRFGWLTYVKSTEKTQHQAALGSLHRRGVARCAAAGESPSDFRDRRGHAGCGRQCRHLAGSNAGPRARSLIFTIPS
jgi:hypothetical protein